MEAFRKHQGIVVPLDRANIDTDVIIPKQFLKSIERRGYGKYLMYDWRFLENGEPNPEFTLNYKRFAGATILVTRENFGSGSSRENAVWALQDYGFKVIIAPNFADIFRNNSLKNGLLLISTSNEVVDLLLNRANTIDKYQLQVDLEKKWIKDDTGLQLEFDMDEITRKKFLNGMDDISYTLTYEKQINQFEAGRSKFFDPFN